MGPLNYTLVPNKNSDSQNVLLFEKNSRSQGDKCDWKEQVWCCAELTTNDVYTPKNMDIFANTTLSDFNSVIGWRIYAEHPNDIEVRCLMRLELPGIPPSLQL